MKLPRDISGRELARKLKKLGYHITRQTGSHLRLTTPLNDEHHLTIPDHRFLKVGTLSSILKDVSNHFNVTVEELIQKIF